MSMTNETVKNLMNDAHNIFFKKWRDHIPERDSLEWDMVVDDVSRLLEKYKNDESAKYLILWFLERIEERMKENEKEMQ